MSSSGSRLIRAVRNRDNDTLNSLISSLGLSDFGLCSFVKPNPSVYDLLCNAIYSGRTEIAKELIVLGTPISEGSNCDTPLHWAVKKEDTEIIDLLLERNADIFANDDTNRSAFYFAVKIGNLKITKKLLDHLTRVNSVCNNAEPPNEYASFLACCVNGHAEVLKLFLSRSSDLGINKEDKMGLLGIATLKKRNNVVKVLLEHGVDVNARTHFGSSILMIAVGYGDLATIELILKFRPNIESEGNRYILYQAYYYRDSKYQEQVVDALLDYGFSVHPEDASHGELLLTAVARGRLRIAKILLEYGARVDWVGENQNGRTYLHVAVDYERFEIAELLIRYGADVNAKDADGDSPIDWVVRSNGIVGLMRLLLSSGATPPDTYKLLPLAVPHGSKELIEFVLQNDPKFNVNATYENDKTALWIIVESIILWKSDKPPSSANEVVEHDDILKAEIVEIFLNRGVSVDAKSSYGNTVLQVAASKGLTRVVKVLLEHGANVDWRNGIQDTSPLQAAIKSIHLNVVKELLNFYADSEFRDSDGKTALHLASEYQSPEIVEELLNYGADINSTCNSDHTPYRCAIHSFQIKNANTLKNHILKMKALDLYVNSKDLKSVDLNEDFYNDCKREVEEMKSTMISDSNFSFHAIFTKDSFELTICLGNENIANALETEDYKNIFPIYFEMMRYRYRRANEVKSLLTPSVESLYYLIGFRFPDLVYMKVFSYLSIRDFKNLIQANPNTD